MAKSSAAVEQSESLGRSTVLEVARWVRGFDKRPVHAAALRQAKLLTLDVIGCGLAGRDEEVSRAVLDLIPPVQGAKSSSVIGTKIKTNPESATFANGVLIRVLDLNDYVIGGMQGGAQVGGHPSDNIPVALAFGEWSGRSGKDVLAAIVIGYDVYGRFRETMGKGPWDGVAVSGLAAPAMAGYLMGLDEEKLAHALALSAARAATSATVRNGDISGAKSIANALVAQSGALSARLAGQGVTGPLSVLDRKNGMFQVFSVAGHHDMLTSPLADNCYIMKSHVKAYPCLATGQSAVAAAMQLHKQLGGKLDGIERIEVSMADYPFLRHQQEDPHRIHPESREAADHSFNFLVAVTLVDGEFDLAQFDGERWTDPQIKALMGKMTMLADKSWNDRAPASYPCTVRLIGPGGRDIKAEVPYPPGYSRNGMDQEAVIEKFHRTAAKALDKAGREKVIKSVLALDEGGSLAAVFAALQ